tara:strand:- start:854 stop:1189 length:336 start_codon:yes stop_codon:yes gene_type:complete
MKLQETARQNMHKKTYQLFFGRNTPVGYVTDDAWESFRELLGMTFAGYTIQDVQGAWKGKEEDTKLVTVTTKYEQKVNDLCQAYINTFDQDAVALTVSNPMTYVVKESEVY